METHWPLDLEIYDIADRVSAVATDPTDVAMFIGDEIRFAIKFQKLRTILEDSRRAREFAALCDILCEYEIDSSTPDG